MHAFQWDAGALRTVVWCLWLLFVAIALVATLSPRYFERLATVGGRWVDSKKFLEVLDRRIDIDSYFKQHTRLLGMFVLAALVFFAARVW